jgi:uncharacterized membrane protein
MIRRAVEKREEPLPPEWQHWLADFAVRRLRPHTLDTKPIDWCRWLGFLLRFIYPLLFTPPQDPIEVKPYVKVMTSRSDTLLRVLMFGSDEQVFAALRLAYEVRRDYKAELPAVDISEEQATIIEAVRDQLDRVVERSVNNFSIDYLRSEKPGDVSCLAEMAYNELHALPQFTVNDVLHSLTHRLEFSTATRAKLNTYMAHVLGMPTDKALLGLTLSAVNEFERREHLAGVYAGAFKTLCIVMSALIVVGGVLSFLPVHVILAVVAFCAWIGVFILLIVGIALLVLLVGVVYDNLTWAGSTLGTLALLMGSTDAQDAENSPAKANTSS